MADDNERREEWLRLAADLNRTQAEIHRLFGEPERSMTFQERWQNALERMAEDDEPSAETALRGLFDHRTIGMPSPAEIHASSEYKAAHAEHTTALAAFYSPTFMRRVQELRSRDASAIDDALVFLEADPWCFRSGYMKEELLRYLRHVPLSAAQQERLREVVLAAVRRQPRRDFKEYCHTARIVDSPELRRRLRWLSDEFAHGAGVRRRAVWMLAQLGMASPGGVADSGPVA